MANKLRGVGGAIAGLSSLAEQVQQNVNLALASTLRTGNRALDALLCIVLPLLLRHLLLGDPRKLLGRLRALLLEATWRRPCVRTIEYTEGGNLRPVINNDPMALDNTDRNNLLQRAIRLYIGEHYSLQTEELDTSLVPLRKVSVEESKAPGGVKRRVFSGSYEQLLSFGVRAMPRFGLWTEVDSGRQIWFMQTKEVTDPSGEGKSLINKVTFHIKAYGPRALEAVEAWIQEAFAWYKEQRKAERDSARYFFVAVPKRDEKEKEGDKGFVFKQYKLSEEKSFKSLFFPEKEALLRLVDEFLARKGKFAIEGYPDKLGLLLHGPPGTGKTSLIKALAQYTQRHVVSVSLSRVKTNQELMDLLFDCVFAVQGGELPLTFGFRDLIFVMEDIDAASSVVYARKPAAAAAAASEQPQEGPAEEDCGGRKVANEQVGTLVGELLCSLASGEERKTSAYPGRYSRVEDDELNLAGLLNVLDGVVDSPGRIVVMTTNHPERLDPALVRPGRVNKQLHLGHLQPQCLCEMAEHYLQVRLTDSEKQGLGASAALGLTPAQVEQACAESASAEELLGRLSPKA